MVTFLAKPPRRVARRIFGKSTMVAKKTPRQKRRQRIQAKRSKLFTKGPNGGIQLLLIQSVEHLGNQGDVVEVKRGFAMNYLIPQGLATVATDHHQRMVEKHREKLQELENLRLKTLRDFATEIAKQSVTIEANANDDGHLYGSVGAPEIIAALKQQEIALTADQIKLEGPLKELGLYTVKVALHSSVETDLKVWVVPTVGEQEEKTEKATADAETEAETV